MPDSQKRLSPTGREAWHTLTAEETARKLVVTVETGLTTEVAHRRLVEYGPNELCETPRSPLWRVALKQFAGFVVIMLLVASGLSALLGDYLEAAAIVAITLVNALIGTSQEWKAEQALAALKRMATPHAAVIRDGSHLTIPSLELVPGDIAILEAGNLVPADVRLIEAVSLSIDEAALTGESRPVKKAAEVVLPENIPLGDMRNSAFMGSLSTHGRGRGIVVATGMATRMGLIAKMLQSIEREPTPLQQKLDRLGRRLGYGAIAICALIFLVGLLNHTDPGLILSKGGGFLTYARQFSGEISRLFIVAVSLAIAAVPEGLPAIVTIGLAIGMRRMIKRNVLIRRLDAVETLGSAGVICTDKTGTLTQNQMTVVQLWLDDHTLQVTGEGYIPKGGFTMHGEEIELNRYPAVGAALWAAVLSSDAHLEVTIESGPSRRRRVVGDPTEGALVVAAAKAGLHRPDLERTFRRIAEAPFDSQRKRMSTLMEAMFPRASDYPPFNGVSEAERKVYVVACKGAPDVVIDLCTRYMRLDGAIAQLTEDGVERALKANKVMAKRALRVLAAAYRADDAPPELATPEALEHGLILLGLFGIIDPPRAEVAPAIEKARRAGIRTIMITGDYPDTAAAIAETIGLLRPGRGVLTGAEMDGLDDQGFLNALDRVDVFARVNPEHKIRIVEGLQRKGEVVAMTGDGVNDSPALKRADVGVAMGLTGTDAAKETADVALTDDNFASIVAAVEQGRAIFANIRKASFFLLSSNAAEMAIIFLPTLFRLPIPLTAIQILWLNLVTDGAPALAPWPGRKATPTSWNIRLGQKTNPSSMVPCDWAS
jgi:Ca2+-transporting ATPase